MTIKELGEIMDAGLDSLGLGVVPLSMDQVVLGDLKRSRLHEIKVLFITGMNDGKIPPNLEDRGIISDDEKELCMEVLNGKLTKDDFIKIMLERCTV